MNEAELAKFLEEHSEAMKKAATEAVLERIKRDLEWNMPPEVQKAVNTFMAEEIAPAVVKALHDQKGEIIKAAIKAASQIGDALAETMVTNATKSLASYSARDIITKLVAG